MLLDRFASIPFMKLEDDDVVVVVVVVVAREVLMLDPWTDKGGAMVREGVMIALSASCSGCCMETGGCVRCE